MELNFTFFFNSILLGVGLAMDAFSVSLANGLNEPAMGRRRQWVIAGVFAGFQALMPMLGWICVHSLVEAFHTVELLVPYIALGLLLLIGGGMVREGLKGGEQTEHKPLTAGVLLAQGVATSIDALSVGFTIADYEIWEAVLAAALIAAVTFAVCRAGLLLGKTMGVRLAGKASILGGGILIFIGLEIFLQSLL